MVVGLPPGELVVFTYVVPEKVVPPLVELIVAEPWVELLPLEFCSTLTLASAELSLSEKLLNADVFTFL